MRVLVTGAAGFIGSHLCDRLRADGYHVTGCDNLLTGRRENLPADASEHGKGWFWPYDITSQAFYLKYQPEARVLDLTERDLDWGFVGFAKAMRPDVIVHCAASYDDRDKWHRDANTNVQGAINVAIAARECGARVVYFQTALVYGNNPYEPGEVPKPLTTDTGTNPENSYAISKLAAEQYLRHAEIPLLVLRLANIYGPRNLSGPIPAFFKRLTNGEPCTVVDSRRDFVYIDDLVNLVVQAIRDEATGTYHASTGRDYPISEIFNGVLDALGMMGATVPTMQERGPDDAPTILLDPSRTFADFGWQAITDLDEGIMAAVDWYREHGVTETYTHLAVKG